MSDNRWNGRSLDTMGRVRASPILRILFGIADVVGSASEIARMLHYRCDLYRSRQQLGELDDDQLRDVGLTRRQVRAEVARPFFED